MNALLSDARYAIRLARRSPGFTAVAVMTLALGIGSVTSIFSLVNGVLLRPLPYRDPGRLVMLNEGFPRFRAAGLPFSPPDLVTVARLNRSFAGMAAYDNIQRELSGVDRPERLTAARVGVGLFPLLGIQPAIGRSFNSEDEVLQRRVALIGDGLWHRAFAADPRVVGRTIVLDRVPHTIVGVLPPRLEFPPRGTQWNNEPADVFVPRIFSPAELQALGSGFNENVIARLKPGVSEAQARADLQSLVPRVEEPYPADAKGDANFALDVTLTPLREAVVGEVRPLLLVLLGAVGLLLLVGCANVANLLLARATGRQREFAMRLALGAGRGRIVGQLLTESALLGLAGGLLGVLVALWGVDLLTAGLPVSIPRAEAIGVDLRVLGFALAMSVATAGLFGIIPALHLATRRQADALREGGKGSAVGRRGSPLLAGLVTGQFALALVLSIGAGLLARSFVHLLASDPGFRTEHVITFQTRLPAATYATAEQVRAFYGALVEKMNRVPGVRIAAASTALPMTTSERRMFAPERPTPGSPGSAITSLASLQGDYFRALQVPLRKGRLFAEPDFQPGAPLTVIVNETLARRFFSGRDPIGQRIRWGSANSDAPLMTIVGVVGDIQHGPLGTPGAPAIYQPFAQQPDRQIVDFFRWMDLVVRTDAGMPPTAVVPAIRRLVRELDPALPLSNIETLEQRVEATVKPQRFYTVLMAAFAVSALLLAALGLWGVLALSVGQRTQEIGVRMALGAGRGQVVRMILRQGIVYAGCGLALGLAASFAFSHVLQQFLYGVTPTDPGTFALTGAALALVALVASYLPAMKATRVDPIVALRYE